MLKPWFTKGVITPRKISVIQYSIEKYINKYNRPIIYIDFRCVYLFFFLTADSIKLSSCCSTSSISRQGDIVGLRCSIIKVNPNKKSYKVVNISTVKVVFFI